MKYNRFFVNLMLFSEITLDPSYLFSASFILPFFTFLNPRSLPRMEPARGGAQATTRRRPPLIAPPACHQAEMACANSAALRCESAAPSAVL